MPAHRRMTVAVAIVILLAGAACGREPSTTAPATGSGAGSGDFGSLSAVCGPGDAGGATDVGVTDDAIRMATIGDFGFASLPGLNKDMTDNGEAFVAWCNSAGGILGRRIELDVLDAKVTDYKATVATACREHLAIAGDGSLGDAAGAQDRVDCGIPHFPAFAVSPAAQDAQLMFMTQPNPSDQFNPGPPIGLLDQVVPGGLAAFGSLVVGQNLRFIQDRNNQGVAALGGTVVYSGVASDTGEASWVPFVQAIKSSGTKALFYIGDQSNAAALLQAMHEQNAYPEAVLVSPNLYTEQFRELAGQYAGDHVYVYSLNVPFEEGGTDDAMGDYLAILREHAPDFDTDRTATGIAAFAGWLLWARAAKACGSNLTRACLAEQASKETTWDAGGIQVPTNPVGNRISECAMLLRLNADGFQRVAPERGFACDASWVAGLPGHGQGARKQSG